MKIDHSHMDYLVPAVKAHDASTVVKIVQRRSRAIPARDERQSGLFGRSINCNIIPNSSSRILSSILKFHKCRINHYRNVCDDDKF